MPADGSVPGVATDCVVGVLIRNAYVGFDFLDHPLRVVHVGLHPLNRGAGTELNVTPSSANRHSWSTISCLVIPGR